MTAYIFFVSLISSINDTAGDVASVLFFFFIIPGLIGWVICFIRSYNYVFKGDYIETNDLAARNDIKSMEAKATIAHKLVELKLGGIRINGAKFVSQHSFGQVIEGKFTINGENGMTNFCVFVAKLASAKFGEKIYFSTLLLSGKRETPESQKIFDKDSHLLFKKLFNAGCLRFITHFQLRHFLFNIKNLLEVFDYFCNNPILEEICLAENMLKVKEARAILRKLIDCPKLNTVNLASNELYADDIMELKQDYKDKFDIIFA